MKLPRNLNGRDLADHLIRRWEMVQVHQEGRHIKLESAEPVFTVSIPAHRPLKIGTLHNILRTVASYRNVTIQQLLLKL